MNIGKWTHAERRLPESKRKNQMRKSIFVGLVVACLVIVGTAVALAQQPSQVSDQLDEGLQFPNEMHSWMTDNVGGMPMFGGAGVVGGDGWQQSHDEMFSWMTDNVGGMPMFGGAGVVGEDGWQQSHDEMHEWVTDNWENMPMHGGDAGGWMTDNWEKMPMFGEGPGGSTTDNWENMPMYGGGARS
jgi:hypothetical protein